MEFIYQGKKYEIADVHKESFSSALKIILAEYEAKQSDFRMQKLEDFNGEKFYIRNYQRGYRWGQTEIEELLNDINKIDTSDEKGYCLQPLVVRNIYLSSEVYQLDISLMNSEESLPKNNIENNSAWELIDGQQRLTTLWLIGKSLGTEKYNIYYELERKVDLYYIKKAKECIDAWFQGKNQDEFKKKLSKVFFIWYEVEDAVNKKVEDVFASINDGKVPLTNAELFKALLLNGCDGKDASQNEKIAFEWDKLEENLRDDDFWYFISNDNQDKKTRIDYLLEVYTSYLYGLARANAPFPFDLTDKLGLKKKIKALDFDKERFSFLVIQNCLEYSQCGKGKEMFLKIWEDVVAVYNKLFAWYKDDELYHTIGFLVASEERKKGSKATANKMMCGLYYENAQKAFSEVKNNVKKKIYERYFSRWGKPIQISDVCYEYKKDNEETASNKDGNEVQVSKQELRAILLFSNIYAGYFGVKDNLEKSPHYQRFPFKTYKTMSWDIEHIRPKELKSLDEQMKEEDRKIAFQSAREALRLEGNLSDENKKKIETDEGLKEIWKKYKENLHSDHELSNLVLLDASTNREYGNAFFCQKRKDIIQFDMDGRFIPLCTKRAFLKYYSQGKYHNDYSRCWTVGGEKDDKQNVSDKMGYQNYLDEMFKVIHEWGAYNG